ncbi:phosphotransferase [Bacillus cereus]|uniref:Phosphotransferase n=1 Tax=Bacillus cereus TaxID=1396 RepID=A0A1S9TMP5_BACCE|nr:phosphotransferase [Bacillus cereus]
MVICFLIAIGNTAKIYLYDNNIVRVFGEYFHNTEYLYEVKKK